MNNMNTEEIYEALPKTLTRHTYYLAGEGKITQVYNNPFSDAGGQFVLTDVRLPYILEQLPQLRMAMSKRKIMPYGKDFDAAKDPACIFFNENIIEKNGLQSTLIDKNDPDFDAFIDEIINAGVWDIDISSNFPDKIVKAVTMN